MLLLTRLSGPVRGITLSAVQVHLSLLITANVSSQCVKKTVFNCRTFSSILQQSEKASKAYWDKVAFHTAALFACCGIGISTVGLTQLASLRAAKRTSCS